MRWMFLRVIAGEHNLVPAPRGGCSDGGFLSFPPWYKGIPQRPPGDPYHCALHFEDLNVVWDVTGNVLIILTQLAGLLAVAFIIYGGIRYITSQGEPENIQSAKKVIVNAIIGLVLAILASTIVGFIAGQF